MEKKAPRPGRAVLAAFFAAFLIKCFLFDFMIADGRSMLPAIKPGRMLMINRLAYGFRLPGAKSYLFRWKLPRPGDIVVFITPGGSTAVKRCDMITGERQFFALGDNSLESYDSRSYGPVPADSILGKAVGIK